MTDYSLVHFNDGKRNKIVPYLKFMFKYYHVNAPGMDHNITKPVIYEPNLDHRVSVEQYYGNYTPVTVYNFDRTLIEKFKTTLVRRRMSYQEPL